MEVPDYVPADWPNIYDPPCVRLDDLMPMEHLPVQISGRGAGRRLQRVGYPPQPATERSP